MSLLGPSRVRGLVRGLLVAALLLTLLVTRVVLSAADELSQADGYRAQGELAAAVVHYRRAARWYAPGSPYHVLALGKLAAIAKEAEVRGDRELALSAYRAIRGAIMATRSFYVPERARLQAADERIAMLMAALPPPPMDAGKPQAQIRAEHLALLSADPGPRTGWTLLLLFGFAAWVTGAFAFSVRAVDPDDRFVPREAKRWGALIAIGFALFVLGMALA